MNFDAIVGNTRIKQQLLSLAESGRLPHAIVIEGEKGLGKRTLAKELALNLLCVNGENAPCRACPQCNKVMKGIHPDVFVAEPETKSKAYPIKFVRESIVADAFVSPNEARYKIYILANCQFMEPKTQNALLKILEEPPEYAIFILTVDKKSALLETVLSRAVVLSLEGVNAKSGAEYISNNCEGVEYEDALGAIEIWGGNIGKALESLKDGKLSKISSVAEEIVLTLINKSEYELLTACFALSGDREAVASVMTVMKTIFRDALVYSQSECLSGFKETASTLSSKLSKEKLLRLIASCDKLKALAEKNCNNNLLITKIPYELRRSIGK